MAQYVISLRLPGTWQWKFTLHKIWNI